MRIHLDQILLAHSLTDTIQSQIKVSSWNGLSRHSNLGLPIAACDSCTKRDSVIRAETTGVCIPDLVFVAHTVSGI